MMTSAMKQNVANEPRIGDTAARQPLSGVKRVDESFAVNGLGHAGYIRREDAEKTAAKE